MVHNSYFLIHRVIRLCLFVTFGLYLQKHLSYCNETTSTDRGHLGKLQYRLFTTFTSFSTPFSQTLWKPLLWNFTHLFNVIRWPCMPCSIYLNWILAEVYSFLDLKCWLNLWVQCFFLIHCVYAVGLKLHTRIQGHSKILYAKSHNS